MSDHPSTIYDALEAVKKADVNRYSRAKRFLATDWKTLKTEADFAAAYDGYQCCVGLLPKEYHTTLKEMRQGLDSYVKARAQITPDEWLQVVRDGLDKLLAILRNHLAPEIWSKCEGIVRDIFDYIAKGGNS